jgi:hypothetical protein
MRTAPSNGVAISAGRMNPGDDVVSLAARTGVSNTEPVTGSSS